LVWEAGTRGDTSIARLARQSGPPARHDFVAIQTKIVRASVPPSATSEAMQVAAV
jgi:hypothetical protein